MSEASYFWPNKDQPGKYTLEHHSGAVWRDAHWNGVLWSNNHKAVEPLEVLAAGYLGVRREPAKPMTEADEDKATADREILEAAQQALDEWRTIQHKPAEVERWAYRWAVDLCERLGAR